MVKRVLKIGSFDFPTTRWNEVLTRPDVEIHQLTISDEKLVEGVKRLHLSKPLKLVLRKALFVCQGLDRRGVSFFVALIVYISKLLIFFELLSQKATFDVIYVSYNDYQDSNFLHAILPTYFRSATIIKAVKETREKRQFLEKISFTKADKLVFTSTAARDFFTSKYPFLKRKKYLLGFDEDWRSSVFNSKALQARSVEKLSVSSGKTHVCILSGRVFSDASDPRSGGRLFYIPLIKHLLKNGYIVHLHCLRIHVDLHGNNQYEKLVAEFGSRFLIEGPLDFVAGFESSYKTLARYDLGILHNDVENTEVSSFDRVNIPNRLYEYLLSGVIPVVNDAHQAGIQNLLECHEYVLLSEVLSCDSKGLISRKELVNLRFVFENYFEEVILGA